MRPIFTIHAGEYVVGEYIESHFRNANVWIPSKDTGIDLLVTDKAGRRSASLQVKFSRDFLATNMPAEFQEPLRACGWWTLEQRKIKESKADFWVFVVVGYQNRSTDFIVIRPKELLRRLTAIHGHASRIQSYLWVTERGRCWETRGLDKEVQREIAEGHYRNRLRDFSRYLNDDGWKSVGPLSR